VDIFTCGSMDNFAACKVLVEKFKAKDSRVIDVRRGMQSFVKSIIDTRDVAKKNLILQVQ
jgi:S-adenosylmethionine/arginine decarboxylase-like enzyme